MVKASSWSLDLGKGTDGAGLNDAHLLGQVDLFPSWWALITAG